MDIKKLRTLIAVAEAGNLTRAAENINMTASGVARQMKAMEKELGITLFHGVPTGVQMTEEGQTLAEEAMALCKAYDQSLAKVMSLNDAPAGPLKVIIANTPMLWFLGHLEEFHALYPDTELAFVADEKKSLHLASSLSGVFIGIIGGVQPGNSTFVWQEIDKFHLYPFAHKSYLAQYGEPTSFAELDNHRLVRYQWAVEHSYLETRKSNPLLYVERPSKKPRKAFLTTDDALFCKRAIEEGLAIGMIGKTLAEGADLIELFKGAYDPSDGLRMNLYAVFPPHLKGNLRVKAFKSFFTKKWKKEYGGTKPSKKTPKTH